MKRTSLSGSLYRLIYRSRNVIDPGLPADRSALADGIWGPEIWAILETARRNNKAANVTGALMFGASGFAQVLEGPRDVVERTFERIGTDPRHTDVILLSFTPTERRSFPDSAMGFLGQTSPQAADLLPPLSPSPNLAGRTLALPAAPTGSDVLRFLERTVSQGDAWIAA